MTWVWAYNAFAYTVSYGAITAAVFESSLNTTLIIILIAMFMGMVFLPEFLWMGSKSFRDWIKAGLEDGDGELSKSDMKDAGIIYVSLWSMRIFMGFSVAMMFGIHVDTIPYILSLLGSFGIAGLTVIGKVIKR